MTDADCKADIHTGSARDHAARRDGFDRRQHHRSPRTQSATSFRVEAVTASTNAGGACENCAQSVGARFAAIADASRYGELKDALSGSGIAAGAGSEAHWSKQRNARQIG